MFQVASHPTSFSHPAAWEHNDLSPVTTPMRSSFNTADIQLPRTLQRPAYAEVSRDQIAAVSPDLLDVPAEYIRRGLRAKTPQMMAGISALSGSLPPTISKSQLRQNIKPMTLPIRPSSCAPTYPSHLLALSTNSKVQSTSDQLLLVPTHSLVLAAHCASLPRMPASNSQAAGNTVSIPVLPLAVPSPAAFQTLHQFLYTHNVAGLLSALLPSLPSAFLATVSSSVIHSTLASGPKLHQLSAHIVSRTQGQKTHVLMSQAQHISALWRNAVALGVHDNELWDSIDLAWEVILGSLNLAAGAR